MEPVKLDIKVPEINFSTRINRNLANLAIDSIHRNFMAELNKYLLKNLKQSYGIEFKNDNEFLEWAKNNRVRRIDFKEEEEVHYYFDYVDKENPGNLFGLTHENRVKHEHKDGVFTVIIG